MSFAEWLNDRRWGANMRRARAYRRKLLPDAQKEFDHALLGGQIYSGYLYVAPSRIYDVTIDRLCSAMIHTQIKNR